MAKPAPKNNFVQSLLLFAMVFLGFQLLFPPKPNTASFQGKTLVTSADVMGSLRDANERLLDVTAVELNNNFGHMVDNEVAAKKITPPEAEAQKLTAVLLLADTQLKAGIARNDTTRIRTAYHTLMGPHKKYLGSPMWVNEVPVTDTTKDDRFGWKAWSGEKLYNKTIEAISERSKHDLIWGVIPGGYALLDFLVKLTGSHPDFSYAFAALMLALVVRAAVYPLAQKQLMFGRQMSRLGPLIAEIKNSYPDDPQTQQKKTMDLYREYGVNPAAGCLPALVQIPLFLTVYQCMTLYQFEFTKGTFLWINPSTSKLLPTGILAPNLGELDSILIVLYGVMMVVSTLLTPVNDPSQAKQQRLMGIGVSVFFTVTMFFGWFPVPGAFVLYWIFLLTLSTIQSLRAYRLPLPPLEKVSTVTGGVVPKGIGGKWAQKMQDLMSMAEEERGKSNGAPKKPTSGDGSIQTGTTKTGTPAKHKPKKRK
jgi:YidC/Oxa1 family membrane protein insertase